MQLLQLRGRVRLTLWLDEYSRKYTYALPLYDSYATPILLLLPLLLLLLLLLLYRGGRVRATLRLVRRARTSPEERVQRGGAGRAVLA